MKEIILIKNGEVALKGLNRSTFEDRMVKTLRQRLSPLGAVELRKAQSTVIVEPLDDAFPMEEAFDRCRKVFGIAGLSRACVAQKDLDDILQKAAEYLAPQLNRIRTFKVEAKRSDKSFPLRSPELCAEVGGYLLEQYSHLSVDVHHPDLTVVVEIRDFGAYIRGEQIPGAGGMPIPTGGRAAVLISGGIDSPVAAWMMAKRGIALTAVHFASPPYTSQRAENKVIELLDKVSEYSGRIRLFIVPFTEIQEQIREHCPEELFTVIMRRFMMRIAQRIARQEKCGALITGESVGQVASQTLDAIACTDAVCSMPVMRPLIGMDKDEIVRISRKIDTFDISIQPYEDCCTVFTPKHPRTKPPLSAVEAAEATLAVEELEQRAWENVRSLRVNCYEEKE